MRAFPRSLRTISWAVALALPMAVRCEASGDRRWADLELRRWDLSASGESLVRDAGLGTLIDFERDLGLGDDEAVEGRLLLFPTHHLFLRLAFVPVGLAGDRVLGRRIEFGGETFDANVRVVSDLDLDYGRAHIGWLFRAAADRFRAGPMVGAAGIRGDAGLGAPDLPFPLRVKKEFDGAFGSLGFLVEAVPIRRLELFGEWSRLVGVDEGNVIDYEVGGRVRLVGELRLSAALRHLSLELKENDDRLKADFDGLSLGLSLRF